MNETFPALVTTRYQVEEQLGRGGSGCVHAAWDRLRSEWVAIKAAVAPGADAHLASEFAALRHAEHPGVLRVRSLHMRGDRVWIASERVAGPPLDVWLAEHLDSPLDVCLVWSRLLRTLRWLHHHGLAHGDVKPANVVVSQHAESPWPVLLDFGFSRWVHEESRGSGGTRAYASPERLRGAPASPAADLFALGQTFTPYVPAIERALRRSPRDAARATWPSLALRALTAEAPDERNADAAARALEDGGAPRESAPMCARALPSFGDDGSLWRDAIDAAANQMADGAGPTALLAVSPDDAAALGSALHVRLAQRGVECWLLEPVEQGAGEGIWARLLDVLAPGPRPVALQPWARAPLHALHDVHRSALETWAEALAEAWHQASESLALVAVAPERWSELDRALLARLADRPPAARLAVITAADIAQLGDEWKRARQLPSSSGGLEGTVAHVLRSHGIEGDVPDAARAAITRAARVGVAAARRQIALLAADGWLHSRSDGRWEWVAHRGEEAPSPASLWAALHERLGPTEQRAMDELSWRGGRSALRAIDGDRAPDWLRLAEEGWVRLHENVASLTEGGAAWLWSAGRAAPTIAERRALVDELAPDADMYEGAAQARAGHLEALGAIAEAASVWRTLSRRREERGELAGASAAALRCAVLIAGAYTQEIEKKQALVDAEKAARHAELTGQFSTADAALDVMDALALQLASPEDQARAALARSRYALHRGQVRHSAEWAERAAARLGDAGRGGGVEPALALDLALLQGLTAVHLCPAEQARAWLERAHALATALGDDHAVGRACNALGTLAYQAGSWREAAGAYREAASAKARTTDVRGERISLANLAMALRAAQDWSGAREAAAQSATLAEKLHDRRGRATALLLTAIVGLDLGRPAEAAAALSKLWEASLPSEVTELDAEVVATRLDLARGDGASAKARAARVRHRARDLGLASIAAEAAPLEVVALARSAARGESLPPLDELAAHLDALGADERAAAHEAPLRIATAWVAAARGDWGRARHALSAISPTPLGRWIGLETTVGLAAATAMLVGDGDAAERWLDAAAELLAERVAAAREVSRGLDADGSHDVAAALALGIAAALPAEGAELLRGRTLRAKAPAHSPRESSWWPTPAEDVDAWATWLNTQAASDACVVAEWEGAGPVQVIGRAGTTSVTDVRWLPAIGAIRGGQGEFCAKNERGDTEVVARAVNSGGQGLGAVVWWWRAGCSSAPSPTSEALGGLGLTLRVRSQARALEHLRRELAESEERATRQEHEHRHALSTLQEALTRSQSISDLRLDTSGIMARSPAMLHVLRTLEKVADTDLGVLLLGESGVGKELLAQAIHRNSARREGPLVAENCGAVPAELFESTFFGHVRGAFTGAGAARDGLFAAAHGGTLFLDEVGELLPEHQVKLLRVLQEGRVRPVGGEKERRVDVRVVAATNQDLEKAVKVGRFREDLYYRLAVISVRVPPLRERREDILPLAQHFLSAMSEQLRRTFRLTPAAAELVLAHPWPGNVRELQNAIWRAAVLADGESIEPLHLPTELRKGQNPPLRGARAAWTWDGSTSLNQEVDALEKRLIEEALRRTEGKKAPAARMLGLSRPGLDAKIERLGVERMRLDVMIRQES